MKRLLPMLLLVFSAQVDAWNPKYLARLKATNECEECDLSGANPSKKNQSTAKMKGVNLDRAVCSGTTTAWGKVNARC